MRPQWDGCGQGNYSTSGRSRDLSGDKRRGTPASVAVDRAQPAVVRLDGVAPRTPTPTTANGVIAASRKAPETVMRDGAATALVARGSPQQDNHGQNGGRLQHARPQQFVKS